MREFTKASWSSIEPGVDFQNNWHIDAIGEHLQAVVEGRELPTDLFKIYTGSVGKFCNADDVKKIIKKGKL